MIDLKFSYESDFQLLDITIQVTQLIAKIDLVLLKQNNSHISHWKKAHYRAIKNWLLKYKPASNNPSNLEKVTGYIEALYHLCKVEDWDKVEQLLSININLGNNLTNYQLHYQLGIWGLYKQQISIYSNLLGKIDHKWDCRFLEGIGNAYDALGNQDQAIYYRQQWRQVARNIENKKEEGKAFLSLGIDLDSFPSDLVLAAFGIDKSSIKDIIPRLKRTHYRAITNWLTKYELNKDTSNLEKVKGLFETFYHFCEVEAWLEAKQIMLVRIDTPTNEELHEQLQTWGLYQETINFYNKLLGKLDYQWEAISLTGVGKINNDLGYFNTSIKYLRDGLSIAQQIGAISIERNILTNLGKTYHFLGNNSDALEANIESLNIAKKIGDRIGESLVMSDLGIIYNAIGDNKKSLYYLQKSLDITQSTENKIGQVSALEGLGIFYLQQNDYEHTVEYSQEQLNLSREIGYRKSEATSLRNLGQAQTYFLESSKALETIQSALEIFTEIGDSYNQALCYYCLAQKYYEYGYLEMAYPFVQKAFKSSHFMNIPLQKDCLQLLQLINESNE
ncbi:tetratricopeptide repeat protein [Okeanomitos corallinicola TIOX110]|uniref:Tetratricopeptide repeat protein n=1 Tax=Okeanomitos corallinicola TIOX110 TaxID=3133117 RepID=A0ABZ2V0Q1_9CYAN